MGKAAEEVKGGGAVTIVLKLDMHGWSWAKKIRRSVVGFPGVESTVEIHEPRGTLTVVGRVDPEDIRHRVATYMQRDVDDIVSTMDMEDVTVEIRVPIHCTGCQGVKNVEIDERTKLVTVKGSAAMDPYSLKELVERTAMDGSSLVVGS